MKHLITLLLLLLACGFCWASPAIEFTEFYGGSGVDGGASIATDREGHIFVTGETYSPAIPLLNPLQSYAGNGDAYVAKFSPDGILLFSTYLGGAGYDRGHEVVVDDAGNIYIAGWTSSSDFPLVRAIQSTNHGNTDAFVAIIDASGKLTFSTYLGGSGIEEAKTLAIDPQRNIVVAGKTDSTDFPLTTGAADRTIKWLEGFVTKIAPRAPGIVFSSYLGGGAADVIRGIAVGKNGRICVVGETHSQDFPVKNATFAEKSGALDAFVTLLAPDGTLVFSTFLGGKALDRAWAVAFSPSGSLIVAGETASNDFPIRNALQPERSGPRDSWISRFSPTGALQLSTYLGGRGNDFAFGLALDTNGGIAVTGRTSSTDFPGNRAPYRGAGDGFVAVLRPDAQQVSGALLFGGSGLDTPWGVSLRNGSIFVTGKTFSPSFPGQQAINSPSGAADAFLLKVTGIAGISREAKGAPTSVGIRDRRL